MADTAIALKSNAQSWLPEAKKLLIGGKWVDAVSYTHLTLPTNREV